MFDMDSSQDADGVVILQLTADEALVLFEWIHRNEDESVDLARAGVTHPAERTVLWDLSACLEAILVRPFSADSFRRRVSTLRPSRLDEACDRLADALGCGDR